MKIRIGLAALLVFALLFAGYWLWRQPAPLSDADSLLLGEIVNQSGEKDFDGSLEEALSVALEQSPRLNLVSDDKVRSAMRDIGQPDTAIPTRALCSILCQRVGAKAFITGTLARTSDGYTIDLEANRCPGGSHLARESESAARADLVIHHLGVVAARLRRSLGESKESLRSFDVPLDRATTPTPAALQAYAQARRANREQGDLQAVPLYKKAIELDSRFALARSSLAVSYYNLSQLAQAAEEIRQAYEAGDRQTVRERLNVTTLYYDLGVGDIEKAIDGYKEYIRTYPRDDVAMGNLSSEYFVIGDYEQAAKYAQDALKIAPDSAAWYENLSTALLALSRVDEAQAVLNEAFSRKLDDAALHANLYSLAFLKGDTKLMAEQLTWAAGKSNGEDSLLSAQSDTEAYFGHLKKAREFTERAVQAAKKADLPESAATWQAEAGLREAAFGNFDQARKYAGEALKSAPDSKDVRAFAALIFARVGDDAKARQITDDLRALYVSNVVMQKAWLPVVQAQTALHKKQNAQAIALLEGVTPYEKGQLTGNLSDSCMIPAYLRGEAYLKKPSGSEALREYQKIENSPGIIGNCWSGPLAKLGIARAQGIIGSASSARPAYQKFLELWKDADSDIPILKEAKAEAAKLR
jgi:eukaryotic-like serine/threonine-protein kinase